MRGFIRCFRIPIQAGALNANSKLLERDYFVAPARDMNAFCERLNQKRIIETPLGITDQIEDSRMAPFTAGRDANHMRENFFRVFILAQHNIRNTHMRRLIAWLQEVVERVLINPYGTI